MASDHVTEEWRPVVGVPPFDYLYEVSNLGRTRTRITRSGTTAGRLLTPSVSTSGYLFVTFCADGKPKQIYVHKLVALAFIGPRPDGYEINHKDFDPLNPSLGNLEYISPGENVRHSARAGRLGQKLTPAKVIEIRKRLALGHKQQAIADDFGVHQGMISGILLGKLWKHVKDTEADALPGLAGESV